MFSRIVGAALFVTGLAIRVWCVYLLARVLDLKELGQTRRPDEYITHGPYAVVKHPAYWGSMMMISGLGMVVMGWMGVVLSLPAIPYFTGRAQSENRLREVTEKEKTMDFGLGDW